MGQVVPLVRKLDRGRCCVCEKPTESGIVLTSSSGVPLLVACCDECFRDGREGATGPSQRAIRAAFGVAIRSGGFPWPPADVDDDGADDDGR